MPSPPRRRPLPAPVRPAALGTVALAAAGVAWSSSAAAGAGAAAQAAPAPAAATDAHAARCSHTDAVASAEPELAARAILCLLNRERERRGLAPLRRSPALAAAAAGHSRDMVRRRYFAHTAPGRVTFVRRIERARYARGATAKLGENLAWGMGDPAAPSAVVRGWMSSAEHRANILDPDFRAIGIGIAAGVPVATASAAAATGATYTTDFGSR